MRGEGCREKCLTARAVIKQKRGLQPKQLAADHPASRCFTGGTGRQEKWAWPAKMSGGGWSEDCTCS